MMESSNHQSDMQDMNTLKDHFKRVTDGLRVAIGLGGLVAVVFGAVILLFPGKTAAFTMVIIAALVAVYALAIGVGHLGASLFSSSLTGWSRIGRILLSVMYIIAGGFIVMNLEGSGVLLAILTAITIGVLWILEAFLTFSLISETDNKAWAIIAALVSLLAGITLVFSPLLGAITLWLFLGISMLVIGLAQIIRAFKIGK